MKKQKTENYEVGETSYLCQLFCKKPCKICAVEELEKVLREKDGTLREEKNVVDTLTIDYTSLLSKVEAYRKYVYGTYCEKSEGDDRVTRVLAYRKFVEVFGDV